MYLNGRTRVQSRFPYSSMMQIQLGIGENSHLHYQNVWDVVDGGWPFCNHGDIADIALGLPYFSYLII